MVSGIARNFGALLLSVAILLLGIGLQNTLIGVRASLEGFGATATGIVMSGYFAGFISGALLCPLLIDRVGHIRAFAVLAAIGAAAAITYAVLPDPILWTGLRIATGACIAGLYMVTESWLNGRAENTGRGQVLASYFIVNLGAMACGQYLLTIADPRGFELFVVASVLISLALVPVALTRTEAPAPIQAPRLRLLHLYKLSPVGVIGCIFGGLANGAFWGMAPVYGVETGLDAGEIALFMSLMIAGGVAFQWPLGRLSDFTDRRLVIVGGSGALILLCVALVMLAPLTGWPLMALGFLMGGVLLTQYALCVAHTNDFAGETGFVQISSGLLLLFGGGAMLGPFLSALLMDLIGPAGLFVFIGAATACLVGFTLLRMRLREAPANDQSGDFVAVPVSPMASDFEVYPEPHETEPAGTAEGAQA